MEQLCYLSDLADATCGPLTQGIGNLSSTAMRTALVCAYTFLGLFYAHFSGTDSLTGGAAGCLLGVAYTLGITVLGDWLATRDTLSQEEHDTIRTLAFPLEHKLVCVCVCVCVCDVM